MPLESNTIIEKRSIEKLLVAMDFGSWLSSGETIISCDSINIDGNSESIVTAGSPTISGSRVIFFVESGLTGNRYTIKVNITTSIGQILEGTGALRVT